MDITEEEALANARSRPEPAYTASALQLKLRGRVGITVYVNKAGEVYGTVIGFGNPVLVRKAIDAVKEWKFTPFKDAGGKPEGGFPLRVDLKPPPIARR